MTERENTSPDKSPRNYSVAILVHGNFNNFVFGAPSIAGDFTSKL